MGCVFLFACSFLWSLWIILLVPIAATCPDMIYSTAWMCFLATVQSTILALFVEQDFSAWKLNSIYIYIYGKHFGSPRVLVPNTSF
ncbi:WAT1-related protein At4g30420 [Linum grandiflorum]